MSELPAVEELERWWGLEVLVLVLREERREVNLHCKNVHVLVLMSICCVSLIFAQQPDTLWTKIYGGTSGDRSSSVQQTTDGGYIIFGETESFGAGDEDVWLIKTDADGDTLWTRTYGGDSTDVSRSGQQTYDGGYIVAGMTKSFGADSGVTYLIKTDSLGDTLWTRIYGAISICYSIQQTSDSGYILAGGVLIGFYEDIYLIKTDSLGDTLWTRTYGGGMGDRAHSVQQTPDGGYVVAGSTGPFGVSNIWLLKTDANGDTVWTKTYGGASWDYSFSVQQTPDSGYIIVGTTSSFAVGDCDVWLLKTDAYGDTIWTKTYGGAQGDWARSVDQTSDGGYIITGYTNSFGAGYYDIYIIKTDAHGEAIWTRTYGGPNYEFSMCVQQTSDHGYIIAGQTGSFGAGSSDIWLLKVEPDTFGIVERRTVGSYHSLPVVSPNPAKTYFTIQSSRPAQRIEIYNTLGQLMREETLKEGNETQKISLNDIATGVYFIKIQNETEIIIKKFTVIK